MKAHMGSGGIAPIILQIGLDGSQWSASSRYHFTPAIESQYQSNSCVDVLQSRSRLLVKEKKLLFLRGFEAVNVLPVAKSLSGPD
jgi:hypothetical protein